MEPYRAIYKAWYAFARRFGNPPVAHYHRKDSFHQRAKREGFRSRAVYKLAELQGEHRLLERGQRVVDLGCWPGGWLQEAARAVGPTGRVVGLDLAPIKPPINNENVFSIVGDIADLQIYHELRERLGGFCDVLLSDAAPKLTGIRETDRAQEERLLLAIEAALPLLLKPTGCMLIKLLECPEAQAFQRRMQARFERIKPVRVRATRKGSRERYLLGISYQGKAAID